VFVHHRLRLLAFPMRAGAATPPRSNAGSPRFRCDPFVRDVAIDPGRASAPRITVLHILPSTIPTVSAPTMFCLSRLIPTPHTTAVYASRPSSPTTAQHSLPGGQLRPYPDRTFTGWIAPAFPGALVLGRVGPGNFTPSLSQIPDMTLSRHPARATGRRLPPSVRTWSSSL
jgi:hypothetical protein